MDHRLGNSKELQPLLPLNINVKTINAPTPSSDLSSSTIHHAQRRSSSSRSEDKLTPLQHKARTLQIVLATLAWLLAGLLILELLNVVGITWFVMQYDLGEPWHEGNMDHRNSSSNDSYNSSNSSSSSNGLFRSSIPSRMTSLTKAGGTALLTAIVQNVLLGWALKAFSALLYIWKLAQCEVSTSLCCASGGWSMIIGCLYVSFIALLAWIALRMDAQPHAIPAFNVMISLCVILTTSQSYVLRLYHNHVAELSKPVEEQHSGLTLYQLFTILKPYFLPRGATNQVRAMSTYVILGISKVNNLVAPLYMASALNALTVSDIPLASRCVLIYATLVFASKALKELQNVVYLKVQQTASIQLAEMTYRHLNALSLEWHLKKKMGDVLRSMDRGLSSANSTVTYMFLYLIPTVVESIVVIFIFAMHFELASLPLLACLSLVLYAMVTIIITLWRKQFRKETTKHDNDYHDKATDCLVNFETVKCFTNEEYEIKRYTEAIRQYQAFSVSVQASLSLLNALQALIIQASLWACLVLAIPHVIRHDHAMDVGAFVAISVYINNLFAPLSFLGSMYNMIINAFVDMQKLSELLSVEPDVADVPNAKPLDLTPSAAATASDASAGKKNGGFQVEFSNVTFHYPEQDPTGGLHDISFTIAPGTTTAVVGPTGSGKTTVSRLLFRFYDVLHGTIRFNHQDITQVQQKSLRQAIGIVPQDTVLFNESILHNVKYGRLEATFEEVEAAARDAQIYKFIMSLPEKWETKVGERGLKLSGGEKQRLAIARTLLKNPPFVILDEATSALDTITEKEIQRALTSLQQNRSMLVIAHRLSTIRNSHQIVVLKQGRIVEKGTHDELIRQGEGGEYKKMWQVQLESRDVA